MKRIPAMLLGASSLLLLLAAASCTDTLVGRPDTDDRTITFQTPQADTRAAVTGTSLTSGSFLVWGWYDDGATNVFDAETVTGDNGVWTYEGTRYWKAGETYDFYAVYPAELPADADADVSPEGTITVTNFDCSATGDAAVDLMTATKIEMEGGKPETVSMNFGHELARVTCDVKSVNSAVTVESVKLYGVRYKGNLTSPGQWGGQVTCSLADTPFKNEEEFVLNADNQFSCAGALDDLLLLPQTFGQDVAAGFQLTYRYNGDQAARTATASIPAGVTWVAGQSYKYTITLKSAQLSLDVTVQDWDEENTSVLW